jgi:deoxyribonuclease IV
MHIGFHLPISKGFSVLRRDVDRLTCEVVQIFVKNPRSWVEKAWADKDYEDFNRYFSQFPVVAHLSYLPNIAKADEDPRNLKAFLHEARLCADIGIKRMVVHCGSRENAAKGIGVAAKSVESVLSAYPVTILLENSAGQGNSIGKSIDQLIAIHESVGEKERLGFVLDSAHLFEAGYDVRGLSVWNGIFERIGERCGAEAIRFFHLNDSKTPIGSAVDRHWHIGRGEIGLSCFHILVNEKKLAHLGGVMETPKMGNMDEENMKTMKSLLSSLMPRPFS